MFCGQVATIIGWEFLFDDIRLYGYTKMVGLARKVGRSVIIYSIYIEDIIPGITRYCRPPTQFVRQFKGFCNFLQLPGTLCRSPVNCCPDADRTHIPGAAHRSE